MIERPASPESTASRVIRIVAATKRMPAETVTPASTLETLGIDSLDRINILFDLEKEFGIEIDDDDARRVHTVGDMIAGVEQLLAARGA